MSTLATSGPAAAAGDCVPAHSLAETVAKLDCLLARSPIARLVVAGDLVESHRPCRRTFADLARLVRWLRERGVGLVVLEGNHDRGLASLAVRDLAVGGDSGLVLESWLEIAGWTIAHGHRATRAARLISGHHHPVLRVSGHSAPLLPGGTGQDHPARVLVQRRGTRRGHRAATRRLAPGGSTLPSQHGSQPARLRPARDAPGATWITVPLGMSRRYRSRLSSAGRALTEEQACRSLESGA